MDDMESPMSPLGSDELLTFAKLANLLVPGDGDMPSAGDAGVVEDGILKVIESCPRLLISLRRGLDSARDAQSLDEMKNALEGDEAAWVALTTATSGAYFLNPEVRRLLGYPGPMAHPMDPNETLRDVEDGLLDGVAHRGFGSSHHK
jgi:hypothetical protein